LSSPLLILIGVLLRVLIEFFFAACTTEIIVRALILRLTSRVLLVNFHVTDRIAHYFTPIVFEFLRNAIEVICGGVVGSLTFLSLPEIQVTQIATLLRVD